MASKSMPQNLATAPNIQEDAKPNDSSLHVVSGSSKPGAGAALPRRLPESAVSRNPNKEAESSDQKPPHKLHETVDIITSTKVLPAGDEKEVVQNGNVKSDTTLHKEQSRATDASTSSARLTRRGVSSSSSSRCRPSTGSSDDVSQDSACKPHKANDSRWEAIRTRDGMLCLSHLKLLRKLGCGDIGTVYLSELTGTRCYFAMKVMDKASLSGRKKLLRAQTEKEILRCLDHPFLPTLYTHFETDKFSCLVMEFCPGGDLITFRRQVLTGFKLYYCWSYF